MSVPPITPHTGAIAGGGGGGAAAGHGGSSKPTMSDKIGYWLISILAMVVAPLLPIFIEAVKHNGTVKTENYLLTAVVLSAGYGFASERPLFQAAYISIFLYSIVFDFLPAAQSQDKTCEAGQGHPDVISAQGGPGHAAVAAGAQPGVSGPASGGHWSDSMDWISLHVGLLAILGVVAVQVIERLIWHLVQDRRFPDWRREHS